MAQSGRLRRERISEFGGGEAPSLTIEALALHAAAKIADLATRRELQIAAGTAIVFDDGALVCGRCAQCPSMNTQ